MRHSRAGLYATEAERKIFGSSTTTSNWSSGTTACNFPSSNISSAISSNLISEHSSSWRKTHKLIKENDHQSSRPQTRFSTPLIDLNSINSHLQVNKAKEFTNFIDSNVTHSDTVIDATIQEANKSTLFMKRKASSDSNHLDLDLSLRLTSRNVIMDDHKRKRSSGDDQDEVDSSLSLSLYSSKSSSKLSKDGHDVIQARRASTLDLTI